MRILFPLVVILVAFASCKDRVIDEDFTTDVADQQRYFPLQLQQPVIYQIDSVVYDFGVNGAILVNSSTTFVKEVITDTLRDSQGRLQWKVEQFERTSDTLPWEIKRIWSAEMNGSQAIRTEENLRFLRLVFPMDRRSEWDGNLWIDANREIQIAGERMRPFTGWNYEVDSINIPRQVGTFSFDSTLVITEVDETNIIERRLSRCVYAKNIGLVWKEQWILDSQYCNQSPPPADCETKPWEQKAERGYLYRQKVIAY